MGLLGDDRVPIFKLLCGRNEKLTFFSGDQFWLDQTGSLGFQDSGDAIHSDHEDRAFVLRVFKLVIVEKVTGVSLEEPISDVDRLLVVFWVFSVYQKEAIQIFVFEKFLDEG